MATGTGIEVIGRSTFQDFQIATADVSGNSAIELVAAHDGYIKAVRGIMQAVNGATQGTITVKNWTTGAAVTVAGLSTTFAATAAKGVTGVSVESTNGDPSLAVKRGDRLQIFLASFSASSGGINGFIRFADADVANAVLP